MNDGQKKEGIEVCIGNRGSYVYGIFDRWVTLPMPQRELDAFLEDMQKDVVAVSGSRCNEFYISDWDGFPLGMEGCAAFSEWTKLKDLNLLAYALRELPENAKRLEAVAACDDAIHAETAMEVINLLVQADDIPYFSYDCDDWYFRMGKSNEEKLGATLVQDASWWKDLENAGEDMNLQDFFDLEDYGRAMSHDYWLGDEGYVSARPWGIKLDEYSQEDIIEWLGLQEEMGLDAVTHEDDEMER